MIQNKLISTCTQTTQYSSIICDLIQWMSSLIQWTLRFPSSAIFSPVVFVCEWLFLIHHFPRLFRRQSNDLSSFSFWLGLCSSHFWFILFVVDVFLTRNSGTIANYQLVDRLSSLQPTLAIDTIVICWLCYRWGFSCFLFILVLSSIKLGNMLIGIHATYTPHTCFYEHNNIVVNCQDPPTFMN